MPAPTGLGRGENKTWDLYSLQALNRIFNAITSGGVPSPSGLATEATQLLGASEATLISVLNAVIASHQDIEILLVRDTGNSDKVVQQITNYQTGTPTVSYKDVNGGAYTPVGPLEYLDPSAVMNLLLTQTTSLTEAMTPVVWQAGKKVNVADALTNLTIFTEPVLVSVNPDATGIIEVELWNDPLAVTKLEVWEILQNTIVIKKIYSTVTTVIGGGTTVPTVDIKLYTK